MSKLHLIFICVLLKFCTADDILNITCEYQILQPGFVYIGGEQYECTLKSNFPYINGEIEAIIGDHVEGKVDADVTVLTVNDQQIFEIPNTSSYFTGLKYINILKSSLKSLRKENLANFKDTLEHLVIRSSEIEVIEKDVFVDLTNLITIDLRNSKIFYIEFNQFSSLTFLANFLLEGNECKSAENQEDIRNIQVSDGTVMADFILKIESSSCGTLDPAEIIKSYQTSRMTNDLNSYEVEQKYDTLFEALNLRNKEFEDLEIAASSNITALTEKYQNATAENEELQQQIDELEAKTSELEAQAEKCMEVNGTCRFTIDGTYGYTCIAHNINVNASGDIIKWSGEHETTSADENVDALLIRDLIVHFMPSKIGETFSNLKILIIRNCGLKKLSKDDFVTLAGLEDIQINGNEIGSIDAGAFDSLTSLKSLDLSENKIKVLPSKIFALLKALTLLNLSDNSLTAVKSDFLPSTNVIESFVGKNNQLSMVESAFVWRLRSATLIDFSGNGCDLKFDKGAGDDYVAFYNSILKKC